MKRLPNFGLPEIDLLGALEAAQLPVRQQFGLPGSKAVRAAIRAAGAKLFFLPPYSPDLNPIEQVFSKLETLLRKFDQRTIEATWRRIGELLRCFSPIECANYLFISQTPDMLLIKWIAL